MTGLPTPPPPDPAAGNPGRDLGPSSDGDRPRWNAMDAILAVPFVYIAAGIIASIVLAVATNERDVNGELVAWAIVVLGLIQQGLQVAWPVAVSRWRGLGLRSDWRFFGEWPKDLGAGIGIGVALIVSASLMIPLMGWLVQLDDVSEASNTDILTDNESSPWLIGILFIVIIGAPFTEELLFRGVILRGFMQNFSVIGSVIASTIIFAILHYQFDTGWKENLVLLSALGIVGLILAIGAVHFDRLAPSIVGHMIFNGSSTLITLLT